MRVRIKLITVIHRVHLIVKFCSDSNFEPLGTKLKALEGELELGKSKF